MPLPTMNSCSSGSPRSRGSALTSSTTSGSLWLRASASSEPGGEGMRMPRSTPSCRPTPATRSADPSLSNSNHAMVDLQRGGHDGRDLVRQRVEVLLAQGEPPQSRDG